MKLSVRIFEEIAGILVGGISSDTRPMPNYRIKLALRIEIGSTLEVVYDAVRNLDDSVTS